tara:strand:+ start:131 stop:472 length:342 start_codon:yes stop_codon:yes gene_type:complete
MGDGKFTRITLDNIGSYFKKGTLEKGALIKYRWNRGTILDYMLDSEENPWEYGIISEVYWYVKTPHPLIIESNHLSEYPKEFVCYEFDVHNFDPSSLSIMHIDPISFEIYILF